MKMGNCCRCFSIHGGATTTKEEDLIAGGEIPLVNLNEVKNKSVLLNQIDKTDTPSSMSFEYELMDRLLSRPCASERPTIEIPAVGYSPEVPRLDELQSHSHGLFSPSKSVGMNKLAVKIDSDTEEQGRPDILQIEERKYSSLPHFKDVFTPNKSNRFLEFTSFRKVDARKPSPTKRIKSAFSHGQKQFKCKAILSVDDLFETHYGTRKPRLHRRRTPVLSTRSGMSPISIGTNSLVGKENNTKKREEFKSDTVKPEWVTKFLQEVLTDCILFQGIGPDDVTRGAINSAIKEMYTHDMEKGEVLVKQGEAGDAFFVVEYGSLDVQVEETESESETEEVVIRTVAKIIEKQTVGEAALMYNTKRNATLVALESTRVWVMRASQFHKIRDLVKILTKKWAKELQKFLSSVPLFAKFKAHELADLTQAFHELKLSPGEIMQNEMFIIVKGKASVIRDRKDSIAILGEEEISEGQWFMPLLNNWKDVTIKAITEVRCLMLDKDDYDLLVAPCLMRIEEKESEDSDPETDDFDTSSSGELPKDFENRVPYSLDDFFPIAVAGSGNFGHVVLVKAEKDEKKEVFALKLVEKNKVINTGSIEHIKNERRVMFMMNSPFIVKLFGTYQDETCVYFLLESVLGGEVWSLLRKHKIFSESMARFYLACVVLGLEHIHSHKIIYRDLKPENLLISGEGYLKITDFGFAKKRNQTTSICGTLVYLAPELINGGIQNFSVDWWCAGIFLYEMLVGQVPFRDSETMKLYEDILESTPQLPDSVSVEAQELVHKLLAKNAFRRLGSRGGADDIKKQPWFSTKSLGLFRWGALASCELKAPYKPELASNEDARHFDPQEQKNDKTELTTKYDQKLYEWCKEF